MLWLKIILRFHRFGILALLFANLLFLLSLFSFLLLISLGFLRNSLFFNFLQFRLLHLHFSHISALGIGFKIAVARRYRSAILKQLVLNLFSFGSGTCFGFGLQSGLLFGNSLQSLVSAVGH